MKKLFYLLPLLVLFVACRQEDPVGESARIVFANQVEELTRADNTLTTANLANFDVWAHNDNGVVFGGTRVEKQGDVWVSAEEKMWEHSLTYHFHAFSPGGVNFSRQTTFSDCRVNERPHSVSFLTSRRASSTVTKG